MGQRRIVILANGDWESDLQGLLALVEAADTIVASDGALDRASANGILVDTLIGDLDSLADAAHLEERFPAMEVLRYPSDKDWTDLELASIGPSSRLQTGSPSTVPLAGASTTPWPIWPF